VSAGILDRLLRTPKEVANDCREERGAAEDGGSPCDLEHYRGLAQRMARRAHDLHRATDEDLEVRGNRALLDEAVSRHHPPLRAGGRELDELVARQLGEDGNGVELLPRLQLQLRRHGRPGIML